MTEAAEFSEIYKLEVIEIPTHRAVSRADFDDEIYRTMGEKNNAILRQIETCHAKGQPVLVGTISIERSEQLASLLKKKKIAHHVLNARYHEQEAAIIAQAGRFRSVTIATNMAGRGTDIVLGGNPEMTKELTKEQHAEEKRKVLEAGGLYVIGTERHESRRIDNQLRGRSGRQEIRHRVKQSVFSEVDLKTRKIGEENMRMMEKRVLLLTLDQLWKDHLLSMDHLRQGINLRAYAQKDPLNEFKREAFLMFDAMLSNLRELVCQRLAQFELRSAEELETLEVKAPKNMHETRLDPAAGYQPPVADIGGTVRIKTDGPVDPNDQATWGKVGRNDNCPCGSGKKYKFCHGKIA